ncbi:zf-HC2 domain-containing protein [Desertimonas flava]|uniref:zf-HC2 domain-containing protein n=1 Tax=Desertimonas flava TaxID=2064846 RepID=UPI0013C4058B|nr:zf-HC2 domain-containing protein [Desertimonas flava]
MTTCERWRDAISALIDGEDPGIEQRLVDAHVAHCPGCRSFRAAAEQSVGRLRIGEAMPQPDLSRRVSKLAAIADRAAAWSIVRALLAVVAIEILVMSIPALVLGDEQDTAEHAARHLGAFTVAYGVGLLVVVWRPARARTMLPVAAVLGGGLVIGAVVDLVNGRVPIFSEMQHLPELISVVLIWLIATPAPRRLDRRFARRTSREPTVDLHPVSDSARRTG